MSGLTIDGNVSAAGGYVPSPYAIEQVADTTSSAATKIHGAISANPPFEPDLFNLKEQAIVSFEPIAIPPEEREWNRRLAKEHDSLVAKEALQTITSAELIRLDKLQDLRRRLLKQVSGETLLRQWRERKAMNVVLEALKKYVRVIERPH